MQKITASFMIPNDADADAVVARVLQRLTELGGGVLVDGALVPITDTELISVDDDDE
jgi:hypothetical protein